jgi:hypothetical protein
MPTINEVLRRELWAGMNGRETSEFLRAHGVDADQMKVGAWKRDRIPSLEQIAQIEAACQVPLGWILWRAGGVDLQGLAAVNGKPPPQVVPPQLSLSDLHSLIRELTTRVSLLEQGGV